jgi:hypothetical protein
MSIAEQSAQGAQARRACLLGAMEFAMSPVVVELIIHLQKRRQLFSRRYRQAMDPAGRDRSRHDSADSAPVPIGPVHRHRIHSVF